MKSFEDQLAACFGLVFPDVPDAELRRASVSSLPAWDSVANINLCCVIEEQFLIELETSELEELISFPLVLNYVEKKCREKGTRVVA